MMSLALRRKPALCNALLGLALLAVPAAAETRDYNPIRRTAGVHEQAAAPQQTRTAPPTVAQRETWNPPVSGPPNQWRSTRQPGPVQLPAPRFVPSQATMQPAAPQTAPAQLPQTAEETGSPEEVPNEVGGGPWQDGSPWQNGASCNGPNCGGGGCDGSCGGTCDSCCQGGGHGFGLCGGNCGGCGGCAGCLLPKSWQLSAGVHGFKGPVDRGSNGNFGFQEGFNLGGSLKPQWGLCYQLGGNFVQSNLQGDTTTFTRTSERDQQFYTVGLFKRSAGCGFQGGVAWDIMHDDYYLDMSLQQLRGELSFVGPGCREFGFMFAAGLNDDFASAFGVNDLWTPTDQYAFFYRRQFGCGGQFRIWAGFTGQSDALLGGEINVPLSNCWSLATNFNYLVPDENGVAAISQEAWALGINLVWYPGGGARCISCCRPLFNVADNASFLVDHRPTFSTEPN